MEKVLNFLRVATVKFLSAKGAEITSVKTVINLIAASAQTAFQDF